MKLGIKILLGYLGISLIFVVLGVVIISTTRTISPIIGELDQEIGKFSDALSFADINTEMRSLRRELHDFAADSLIGDQSVNNFNIKAQRLDSLLDKTIQESDNTERKLYIRLMKLNKQLTLSEKEVLSIPEENKLIEALEILGGEYEDLNSDFFDTLVTISNSRKTESQDVFGSLIRISSSNKINKEKFDTLVNVVVLSIILVIVLSILLGFFISRSISKPITKLKEMADKISKGNLAEPIKIEGKDEIGELAESFDDMRYSLKRVIDEYERKFKLAEPIKKPEEQSIPKQISKKGKKNARPYTNSKRR